jgi:hypothetical protein
MGALVEGRRSRGGGAAAAMFPSVNCANWPGRESIAMRRVEERKQVRRKKGSTFLAYKAVKYVMGANELGALQAHTRLQTKVYPTRKHGKRLPGQLREGREGGGHHALHLTPHTTSTHALGNHSIMTAIPSIQTRQVNKATSSNIPAARGKPSQRAADSSSPKLLRRAFMHASCKLQTELHGTRHCQGGVSWRRGGRSQREKTLPEHRGPIGSMHGCCALAGRFYAR